MPAATRDKREPSGEPKACWKIFSGNSKILEVRQFLIFMFVFTYRHTLFIQIFLNYKHYLIDVLQL